MLNLNINTGVIVMINVGTESLMATSNSSDVDSCGFIFMLHNVFIFVGLHCREITGLITGIYIFQQVFSIGPYSH